MKISEVRLLRYKRFTDLRITDLPLTARLIILAGPNGCGKSSLFDALNNWHRHSWKRSGQWDPTYHVKPDDQARPPLSWTQSIQIEFHAPQPTTPDAQQKAFYVRSAYRNDPEFNVSQLQRMEPALTENRLPRIIENDATVGTNYQRLASQGLEDVYERESPDTTIGQFRERTIGEIRDALKQLFPELILNGLGNPLSNGTFRFDKGTSKGFLYKNLSGGEKAALDLLLDMIVKRREFDDTVFCIDEPEAHMNTRLQGRLLEVLFGLVPANSQMWVATHSIGMMRRARDLALDRPGEVVFLDFEHDFDKPKVLRPLKPTRAFWQRVLNTALDDLADLVAPSQVVLCEGPPSASGARREALDAACYGTIFAEEFPDTRFIAVGNAHEVTTDRLALLEAIRALVKGTQVLRVVDRDDLSLVQVAEREAAGLRVLSRRHLEVFLFDEEILRALCLSVGKAEEADELVNEMKAALANGAARGKPPDDVKSAAGEIYVAAKRRLQLTGVGNDARSFMRDTLAPLLKPDMAVYQALRKDVFGC